MLNNIVSTYKIKGSSCKFPKYTYLCNVFFIVLDFKVNKGWSTAVLLFLFIYSQSTNPIKYPIKQVSILLTKR